ncbi:MAG: DUF4258 domain-containing protein [Spirochaetes bacterium]|nr:MAG: DUF4258 domain-containing protein [Spirochaetota bacterium]
MKFAFDKSKNEILRKDRGVSFYDVIEAIAEKGILLNIEHPNREKYPDQFMLVIEYNNYTYCVPYERSGDTVRLITLFPNREYLYLLEGRNKNGKN